VRPTIEQIRSGIVKMCLFKLSGLSFFGHAVNM